MTVRGAERIDTEWLLTMRHVAERLNVSYRTVERMVANGDLPHIRVTPHVIRIHPADLCAYLKTRRQEAAPPPSVTPSAIRPAAKRRDPSAAARPSFLDELTAAER